MAINEKQWQKETRKFHRDALKVIDSARDKVIVYNPGLVSDVFQDGQIAEAIKRAKARDIKITILVQRSNSANIEAFLAQFGEDVVFVEEDLDRHAYVISDIGYVKFLKRATCVESIYIQEGDVGSIIKTITEELRRAN
ncbi:MAG: hypothetical protein WC242_02020 [Candidatus Paceibacterota bacterium]|jgi:hypothetical protein